MIARKGTESSLSMPNTRYLTTDSLGSYSCVLPPTRLQDARVTPKGDMNLCVSSRKASAIRRQDSYRWLECQWVGVVKSAGPPEFGNLRIPPEQSGRLETTKRSPINLGSKTMEQTERTEIQRQRKRVIFAWIRSLCWLNGVSPRCEPPRYVPSPTTSETTQRSTS